MMGLASATPCQKVNFFYSNFSKKIHKTSYQTFELPKLNALLDKIVKPTYSRGKYLL